MKNLKRFAIICVLFALAVSLWAGGGDEQSTTMSGADAGDGGMVNSSPMSDLRVRQAIAYAIDMDTIAESILEGMAVVADSMIPNGTMKKPGLEPYAYDPDKAKALLKAANWDSSTELEMIYYYGDQQTVDLMTAIQAYLADVGIKMNFRQTTDTQTELNLKPDDLVNGPAVVYYDPAYGAHAALALQAYFNGYATGHSHSPIVPEVVELVAAINASPDPDKQKPAFFEIEQYFSDNLPTLPLYYQPMFIFESTRIDRNGGLYGNPQYNYDWGIVDWNLEPDANGKRILNSNGGPIEKIYDPWSNPGIRISTKVLFDRLLACDGSLVPTGGLMAEDYSLSADGLTLDITLKDGLTWHDGSPLTIDDVKFSVEMAIQVPVLDQVFKNTFLSLEGIEDFLDGKASGISGVTTSGNSITFKLSKVDPNVLLTFTQFAILPEKYLGGIDPLKFETNAYWQMPIGSGSFKVKEVKMNDYLQMVPFEDYHGGVAKIDQIVVYPTFDSDPNVVKNAASGRLDYAFGKNTAEVASMQALDNIRVTPVDVPYTRMIWFQKYPKAVK